MLTPVLVQSKSEPVLLWQTPMQKDSALRMSVAPGMGERTSIDQALDYCLEDIRYGRAGLDECLARYPEFSSRLRPLLIMALRLETVNEVRPSREFKFRLRKQIAGPPPHRRGFFSLRAFLLGLVALGLIVSLLLWAEDAFPGQEHLSRQISPLFQSLPSMPVLTPDQEQKAHDLGLFLSRDSRPVAAHRSESPTCSTRIFHVDHYG